jgi:serine/threonine protein kinase
MDGNSKNQTSNDEETQLKGDFVREVALLKRLRHPHVVLFMGWFLSSSSYLAADAEHESLCFVTELCWTSLYHLLHAGGGSRSTGEQITKNVQHLHWPRRLAMCLDAAKGMCFLHGEGIIHRDLKSANLLVDRSYRVRSMAALSRCVTTLLRRMGTDHLDA